MVETVGDGRFVPGDDFALGISSIIQEDHVQLGALPTGEFIAVWRGRVESTTDGAIYLQRFTNDGDPIGSPTIVSTSTQGSQDHPGIAMLANGGYAISWKQVSSGMSGSIHNVKVQIFDAQGNKVGGEIVANSGATVQSGEWAYPAFPVISALSGGGFVVAWENDGSAEYDDVAGQVFTANGTKVGGEIRLSDAQLGDKIDPTIVGLSGGGFVAAWHDTSADGDPEYEANTNSSGIRAQVFDAAGTKVGSAFVLNSPPAGTQNEPAVAALPGGGFVAAWVDIGNADTSKLGVWIQRFDSNGQKVGSAVEASGLPSMVQNDPVIEVLPGSGFMVVWKDAATPSEAQQSFLRAQLFSFDGVKVGEEFALSADTGEKQYRADAARLADGSIVVGWTEVPVGSGLQDARAMILEAIRSNSGNDVLASTPGNDTLDGGAGVDTVDFWTATSGITVDLAVSGANATGHGSDTLIGIENVEGSGFNDNIAGDGNGNVLLGRAGNDTILGRGGADVLFGGAGDDQLNGGFGNDRVEGNDGNDVLLGGEGDDILDGGSGSDTVDYWSATQRVIVDLAGSGTNALGEGLDTLIEVENIEGSAFGDRLFGDAARNLLLGRSGDDALFGRGGADLLFGGAGNDTLDGGADNDRMEGGDGNDVLTGGAGDDMLDGGAGVDTVDYWSASQRVVADLAGSGTNALGEGADTLVGIENLEGSSFNDRFFGDGSSNVFLGRGGDDVMHGRDGADLLLGGGGNDELDGGADNDRLEGGSGNDILVGGTGDDILDGGDGVDTVDYWTATQRVVVDLAGSGSNALGQGVDTLIGVENLEGTKWHDRLFGDGANNLFVGRAGDDTIYGRGGTDVLLGGAGNDLLYGDEGNDRSRAARATTSFMAVPATTC